MKLGEWQFYWPKWHLGWSKRYDEEFDFYELYIFIGPLQLRFWL